MNEAIQDFSNYLEATGRSPDTIRNYLRSLEWLIEFLTDMPLQLLNGKDICTTIVKIKKSSRLVNQRSPATMNRIICSFRSFFKWCLYSGYMTQDLSISLRLAKVHSAGAVPVSLKEIESLLNTIHNSKDAHASRDKTLFSIYAFTGIRRSEALPLRIKDYDPVSSTLTLNHTKGGGRRRQPVPSMLAEVLDSYINMQKKKGAHPDDLLFPGRKPDRTLSKRQVNARFEKWKRLSVIRKNLTIHSFRAGFATHLYHSSKDILMVARALGHRHIRATDIYVANDLSFLHKAVDDAFGERLILHC